MQGKQAVAILDNSEPEGINIIDEDPNEVGL